MSTPSTIVNSNTSIVPVYCRNLIGQHIVYLSTTAIVGQLITVRDMDGYLSSPQTILISTTEDAFITGGISSTTLQQGFGYATLRSAGNSEWTIVNVNSLDQSGGSYSIRGLAFSTLNVFETPITRHLAPG